VEIVVTMDLIEGGYWGGKKDYEDWGVIGGTDEDLKRSLGLRKK